MFLALLFAKLAGYREFWKKKFRDIEFSKENSWKFEICISLTRLDSILPFKNYLIKIISQIIRVESLYSLPKKFLTYFTIYLLKLAINHSLPFPLIFK